MYLDGREFFNNICMDKVSYSLNFINDYGNMIIAEKVVSLLKAVSYCGDRPWNI